MQYKILTIEKRGGLQMVSIDRMRQEFFFISKPVLGELCFYYLNAINSFKHGINIELRHGLMWLVQAETEISF
jgi:hypothetical protein